MEHVLPAFSALLSLAMALIAWSINRNVKAMDDALKKQAEANAALEIRVRALETETVNELRKDLDDKLVGIQGTVDSKLNAIQATASAVALDVAVLKERLQNVRAFDRRRKAT